MTTPRLRAKLAGSTATQTVASEKDKDETVKGKKAEKGDDENEASSEDEDEDDGEGTTPPKKDGKKAVAAPTTKALSPERARMKAITTGPSASALPTLAAHLAYGTDLSAEDAAAVFEAVLADIDTSAADEAPTKEASTPKGDAFRKAMNAEAGNPKLGAAGGKVEAEDPWIAAAKGLGVA